MQTGLSKRQLDRLPQISEKASLELATYENQISQETQDEIKAVWAAVRAAKIANIKGELES